MNKFGKEEGIIYRIYNSNESDKVLLILNNAGEKKTLLCKNVRKSSSKTGQLIDLGNYISVRTISDYALPIVSEVFLKNAFLNWKREYKKLILLQTAFEILDKFLYEDDENIKIFNLLVDFLENSLYERPNYLLSVFLLQLLHHSGFGLNKEVNLNGFELNDSKGIMLSTTGSRILKSQKYIIISTFKDALKLRLGYGEEISMLKLHIGLIEDALNQELKSKQILLSILN